MSLLLLALLTLFQSQTATVEGTVTKPGGGEPLGGARITLSSEGPETRRQFSGTSEDDGRFTLTNIPAGNYTLTAESARYGVVTFGQRRAGGPALTLSITEGQRLTNLRISMMPTGAIAGRITGRNGEPVVRASVQAFQSVYQGGKRTFEPVQAAIANDLGEYRLFWLPPGKYLVAATLGETGLFSPYGPETQLGAARFPTGPNALFAFESFLGGRVIRRLLDDGSVQ